MNPWVRTGTTQARTRIKHYYAQRLMQGAFWRKLLSGKVAVAAGTEVLQNLRLAIKGAPVSRGVQDSAVLPLARRMALAWADFGQRVLLVLSEQDYTAKEFLETVLLDENLRSCMTAPSLIRIDVEGADHTFSQPATRKFVEAEIVRWLRTASDKDSANLR